MIVDIWGRSPLPSSSLPPESHCSLSPPFFVLFQPTIDTPTPAPYSFKKLPPLVFIPVADVDACLFRPAHPAPLSVPVLDSCRSRWSLRRYSELVEI